MLQWAVLAALLIYGTGLRSWQLGASPLWTDEAETSINALTILQHGVPVGHYLGMPIFENTFTQSWPESREYEFRDTSYSDRGVAIYHGWLPLYAIAASFAANGISADDPSPDLTVRYSVDEMYRRTVAARIPSVVFGVLFLVAIFYAGREFYGKDAGWAALAAASVSTTGVNLAREARYYSLTLALSALCAWGMCLMVKRGRARDFVAGGILFVLLFHTNMLAFAGVCAAFGLSAPFLLRQDRIRSKLAALGGILAAGILPWILATGFIASAPNRPMARSLLEMSQVTRYAEDRLPFALLAAATLVWLLGIWRFGERLPGRLVRPFASSRPIFFFFSAWVSTGFLAFIFLTPAASFFYSRLTLTILVPCLLFGAMLFAAIGRTIMPRHSSVLAAGLLVLLLYAGGKTTFWWPEFGSGHPHIFEVIEGLRKVDIPPGTRLYADTGASLPLTFYSGLPFQNVMPVRRSFLDAYDGQLVIVEGPRAYALSWEEVQKLALAEGVALSDAEARRTARRFNEYIVEEQLKNRVVRVSPSAQPVPEFFPRLAVYQRFKTEMGVRKTIAESGNPIFSRFEIKDYTTLWQVFFYRFVNPEARMGANLNYSGRSRRAEALLMPGGWVVLRCPARLGASNQLPTSDTGSTNTGRVWR